MVFHTDREARAIKRKYENWADSVRNRDAAIATLKRMKAVYDKAADDIVAQVDEEDKLNLPGDLTKQFGNSFGDAMSGVEQLREYCRIGLEALQ